MADDDKSSEASAKEEPNPDRTTDNPDKAPEKAQDTPKDPSAEALAKEDWRESVPEEYREIAKRFETVDDLVKSYAEADKRIAKSVVVPGKDATEEDWNRFIEKVRPKSPDGYQVPELEVSFDDEAMAAFRSQAHRLGLSQRQFEGLLNVQAEAEKQFRAVIDEGFQNLKKEWADDYQANLEIARRQARALGFSTEEIEALQDKVGDATLIAALYKMGARRETVREITEAGSGEGGRSLEALQQEALKLQSSKAYQRDKDPATHARVREIYRQIEAIESAA